MKKLVQLAVGGAAMCAVAHVTWETPLHHWMVILPVFLAGMYGTAVIQHYRAHRRPR
jgi:hypothetical protein